MILCLSHFPLDLVQNSYDMRTCGYVNRKKKKTIERQMKFNLNCVTILFVDERGLSYSRRLFTDSYKLF